MQLLIIVLNMTQCLEELLAALADAGITGATIINSTGMAHSLYEHDELKFMASLRKVLNPDRAESKTIFMVLPEEKIPVVSEILNVVTGGLDQPDTGIMFTLPVNHLEGLK